MNKKQIRVLSNTRNYPLEDLQRIRKVFFDRGYDVTHTQCAQLWSSYSEAFAANWLILDSYTDDEIYDFLRYSWVEVKE